MFDNLILNNNKEKVRKLFDKEDNSKKVYIETYGCQMNLSDSEIVLSILSAHGYNYTEDINESDIIFLNTCSIRDNAEKKIYSRLKELKKYKKLNPYRIVGILGCMAERLRKELLEKEKIVDIITGPDEYRKLPLLIEKYYETGEKGIAVRLSKIETYDDIVPIRKEGVTAWISVMRGCDKFCTFCVVPFTRGRERSRKAEYIVNEAMKLFDEGIKEITLLGQNVNSYNDNGIDFPDLLRKVAISVPEMRIRYTTSHPYDCSKKLLDTMAEFNNICKYIHLPVQSGSERILRLMNRLYSISDYIKVINYARTIMPDIALSTDIIAGFPTETENDHQLTLNLLEEVEYDGAYTFAYSRRENTKAYFLDDDISPELKKDRLNEIIELQRKISLKKNKSLVGLEKTVLIETLSKKSADYYMGRTDCNRSVILPVNNNRIGDLVNVRIQKANSATLFA